MRGEKGIGLLPALLVMVGMIFVLGVGVIVFTQNRSTPTDPVVNTPLEPTVTPTDEAEPANDAEAQSWRRVDSEKNGFSIRIPDGWLVFNYLKEDRIRGNDIAHAQGAPGSVQTVREPYTGNAAVRFQVYQGPGGKQSTWSDVQGQPTESKPFFVGNLEGKREYVKLPSNWQGCCTYPDTEMYRYTFNAAGKVTTVEYNIFNYDPARGDRNFNGIGESDKYQAELIDRVVRTLEIR